MSVGRHNREEEEEEEESLFKADTQGGEYDSNVFGRPVVYKWKECL